TEEWRKFAHTQPGIDLDDKWRSKRTLENDFLQDRQMMKLGNFTGVLGIPNQDIVMWVSMGARVDRSSDLLGASDLAIVEFRRLMSDAARRVAEGGVAIGTEEPRVPHASISSKEGVYSKEIDWRKLGTEDEKVEAAE
ncbi:MAG: (2Fe-2S)-binding protein, partial [Roseovarius indicus]